MQVAALLMRMLRDAGVDYLFGNPGTTELPFLDALDGSRASPSINGSSVVPGLPNITETPSCFRISRNACLPAMSDMARIINRDVP